jgi:hypothetical protein
MGHSDVVLNLKEKNLFLFLDLLGAVAKVYASQIGKILP